MILILRFFFFLGQGVALELVELEATARAIHGNMLYLIVK